MYVRMSRALLLCLLVPAAFASATVLRPIALEDLVRGSDAVVRAHVLLVSTEGSDADHVRTCATLAVDESFKGNAGAEIRVCERGGTLANGETLIIAGTPRYAVGSAVLAMLSALPDGTFRTFGFSQGIFHIVRDTEGNAQTLVRDLDQVSWLNTNGAVSENEPVTVPTRLVAATLFAQIRSWVGGAR